MAPDRPLDPLGGEFSSESGPTSGVETHSTVSSGGLSFGLRTLALVGVGVGAAIGGWFAFGGGSPPADTATESTAESTLPEVAVRYVDETPTTTTTTSKSAALIPPSTAPSSTLPPGSFLLGARTGLWLFYGGEDPLQRLDLDNGELLGIGTRAVPVAANGEDIVLYQAVSGVYGWVLAEDPGEQPLGWRRGPVAAGPEPGQLWILDPDGDAPHPAGAAAGPGRWELYDLQTVRILERRPGEIYEPAGQDDGSDAAGSPGTEDRTDGSTGTGGATATTTVEGAAAVAPLLGISPDLSNRPDGVYRYQPDGYRRLAAGRAVVANSEVALVQDCTEDGCRTQWIGQADGAGVDLPVPEGEILGAELMAGGRWLRTIHPDGGSVYLDLETGLTESFGPGSAVAVSPDSRWLAVAERGRLQIFDLLQGGDEPMATLDLFIQGEGGSLLFVER